MSAPSQLAHVTWIHVTGSRKSWNSWLIEYVGIIKTQCVFQQNQARGQEFISNWCLSAYFTVKNFLSLPIITKIFMYLFFYHGEEAVCTCQFCSVREEGMRSSSHLCIFLQSLEYKTYKMLVRKMSQRRGSVMFEKHLWMSPCFSLADSGLLNPLNILGQWSDALPWLWRGSATQNTKTAFCLFLQSLILISQHVKERWVCLYVVHQILAEQ